MNNIEKNTDGKIVKPSNDDRKIRLGGKVGIGFKITFPGSVEGEGDAKISFKLPSWLSIDILRRLIKSNHNNEL
jgi:hypothetical protein